MLVTELTVEDKRQLAQWAGLPACDLKLIYSADRDGCTMAAFHQLCDNKGPLLVIANNEAGYLFGGYATQHWVQANTYPVDQHAFLFRLRKAHNVDYVKYSALNNTAVMSNSNAWGPAFGNTDGNMALHFIQADIARQDTIFPCANMSVTLAHGFNTLGHADNELHGGNTDLHNLEVYHMTEMRLYDDMSAWCTGLLWDEQTLTTLKSEISRYEPYRQLHVPQVRVLMVGQIAAGKSSFFNTINSSFRGHVTAQAASGSSEHSLTTQYRTYQIRQGRGGNPIRLRLCDTMGLEEEMGLSLKDLPYMLDGNIQDRFQFNPAMTVTPQHSDFLSMVKLKDRIHVMALVVDGGRLSSMSAKMLEKLTEIRTIANQRGVPIVVILTKIDDICPYVAEDVSRVYVSMAIKEHVDIIAEKLGIPQSQVLPVKNYRREQELIQSVDILALSAVRQILRAADDFFDDQLDLLGLQPDEEGMDQ